MFTRFQSPDALFKVMAAVRTLKFDDVGIDIWHRTSFVLFCKPVGPGRHCGPTGSEQHLSPGRRLFRGRREILCLAATAHPSAEWISHQLTEAYGWEEGPGYLVRDRDRVYGEVFTRRLRAMGIRDRPTAPRSPWQNGYCERLIGSIRRECLDYIVVFGERHLRHLLRVYANYYNRTRTHLSLNKDSPASRAIGSFGCILAVPILGGLHHRYVRI